MSLPQSPQSQLRYPRLVAFDLDYTLWDLWIDTHVTGPLRRHDNTTNEVLDKYGEKISFYPDVPTILHELRSRFFASDDPNQEDRKVVIALCSRTSAIRLATQCLQLLLIPASEQHSTISPVPAIEFFEEVEIYPGSKINHFKAIHGRTGIPYSEMLFFDDELRNLEVEKLGVTFHHVRQGMTYEVFQAGLTEWRRRHPAGEKAD